MNTITSSLNGQLWAFNMIAHNTYDRFQDELDLIKEAEKAKKSNKTVTKKTIEREVSKNKKKIEKKK